MVASYTKLTSLRDELDGDYVEVHGCTCRPVTAKQTSPFDKYSILDGCIQGQKQNLVSREEGRVEAAATLVGDSAHGRRRSGVANRPSCN